jgi:hypothetical protein
MDSHGGMILTGEYHRARSQYTGLGGRQEPLVSPKKLVLMVKLSMRNRTATGPLFLNKTATSTISPNVFLYNSEP